MPIDIPARFNSEFTFLNNRVKLGENITMAYRTSHGVSNLDEGSPIQHGSLQVSDHYPCYMGVTVHIRDYSSFWER